MPTVPLDQPPEVANVGVGVHGVLQDRDVYNLPDLWQLHLYQYSADLIVNGVDYAIRPGRVSLVPPGTRIEFRYRGRSQHLYAHLRMPGTGAGAGTGEGAGRQIPYVQDAGAQTPTLTDGLLRAIAARPSAPARAVAEVWAALWTVAELSRSAQEGQTHAAVATAIAYVESHLADPLTVPEVAAVTGVSHNHLTRLFRAQTGDTVIGYIRRRRLDRARHLLRETTLSIAAVAASVGIDDLQAFNKACRRELGASPRAVRAGTGSSRL
jgi:AraC-like DNA-binding protein